MISARGNDFVMLASHSHGPSFRSVSSGTDRMPYANVNGQRLYYEDTGGAGPVIIFSHGLLLDGTMFAPQVAALGNKYRCIIWDERGHGKTAGETLEPFSY